MKLAELLHREMLQDAVVEARLKYEYCQMVYDAIKEGAVSGTHPIYFPDNRLHLAGEAAAKARDRYVEAVKARNNA